MASKYEGLVNAVAKLDKTTRKQAQLQAVKQEKQYTDYISELLDKAIKEAAYTNET